MTKPTSFRAVDEGCPSDFLDVDAQWDEGTLGVAVVQDGGRAITVLSREQVVDLCHHLLDLLGKGSPDVAGDRP